MVGTKCWGAKAIAEGLTSPQSQRAPKATSSNKAEKVSHQEMDLELVGEVMLVWQSFPGFIANSWKLS